MDTLFRLKAHQTTAKTEIVAALFLLKLVLR